MSHMKTALFTDTVVKDSNLAAGRTSIQSHVTADGQSVSQSWRKVSFTFMLLSVRKLWSCRCEAPCIFVPTVQIATSNDIPYNGRLHFEGNASSVYRI
jgi:hypothetical protein